MGSTRPFRAEDWWVGKASLLLGLVYLLSIYFSIPFVTFWWYSFLSLSTIIGFASFGYLVNDYFDQEKDAKVGKKNFLLGKSATLKTVYCLVALFILFWPWYFLPHNSGTYALIALQLCSYFIYSVPPIRLKERGFAGLIVDAMYAHAIPAVLAAYTYMLIAAQKPSFAFFNLLFCWQFCVGIRNVLLHQLNDQDNDRESKTSTFVQANKDLLSGIVMKYLKGIELLFLILLLLFLSSHNVLFLTSVIILGLAINNNFLLDKGNEYRYYFPNMLYDQWLPYSYILILCITDIRFLLLLPIQVFLFTRVYFIDQYKKIPFGDYYDHTREFSIYLFIKFKLLVNWLIYLVFRLGGINLIKEKTDAKGFILRKLNKQK